MLFDDLNFSLIAAGGSPIYGHIDVFVDKIHAAVNFRELRAAGMQAAEISVGAPVAQQIDTVDNVFTTRLCTAIRASANPT